MSYGVQFRCTHKAQTNNIETTFRIDILKNGYSGAVTEVLGYGDVFSLNYDKIDPTEPLKEPIQKGRLDFNILVQGSTEENLLTNIFESGEGTYQMALYRDGTLVWKGYVLNDLLEISQDDYPFEAKISAKDFTRLEQFEFPLSSIRRKVITTIGDLLNDLGLGLGFKVYPNWTHEEISGDILGNIYLDERQLRDFGEIGEGAEFDEDDRSLTHTQCLELILKSFGMIIRQSEGYYRLFHLSALTDTSTTEYTYDSTSALISTQTVNLVKSIDKSSRFILPSSQTNFNAGLKRASATLVHNTAQSEIKFDRNIVLTEDVLEQSEETQFFNSNGKQTLRFKTKVSAEDINSSVLLSNPQAVIRIFIDGPTDYYLTRQGDWVTDETDIVVNLTSYTRHTVGIDRYYEFFSSLEIESTTIPTSADGTLTIQVNLATHSGGKFPVTSYGSNEFEIISEEDAENSVNIAYELVSDSDFSKSYDHGTIAFGDGPTPYSPSALYYGTADGERTDGGWSFVGSSDKKGVQRLLLEEIMNMQSQATRNLRAQLYGNFNPHELISYESRQYMFLGGSLNGNNVWSADFLHLNFVEPTVSFQELADAKKGGGFTGASSGTVESFWSLIKQSQFFNTIFLSNYVGELSVPISAKSTITSFTADLFAEITEGEDFIIVDKENERPFFVNVIGQYNTGEDVEVTIEEQFISNELPVGSPIILSGGLLQSYFRIDPTKLAISVDAQNDSTALGRVDHSNREAGQTHDFIKLSNDLISASNPVQVKDDEQLVLRSRGGAVQTLVADGDQTYTSSPFQLQVDEFTHAFDVGTASYTTGGVVEALNASSSIARIDIKADENEASITSLTSITTNNGLTASTNITQRVTTTEAEISSNTSILTDNGLSNSTNITQRVSQTESEIDSNTSVLTANGLSGSTNITQRTSVVEGEVDTVNSQIVLKADAQGNISAVRLDAGPDGSNISITADSIDINNITFDKDAGTIASDNYSSGSAGWEIDGNGNAEFNAVTVRSANFSSNNAGFELSGDDVQVNGDLTVGAGAGGRIVLKETNGDDFLLIRKSGNLGIIDNNAEQTTFQTSSSIGGSPSQLVIQFNNADSINGEHILRGSSNVTNYRTNIRGDLLVLNDIDYFGTLTDLSDKLAKENVVPLGQTLDKITQLDAKVYELIGHKSKREIGLFAQDVEPLFPEAVGERTEENEQGEEITYKTLSYIQLIPALIESIKELKQEIDQLKNEQGI